MIHIKLLVLDVDNTLLHTWHHSEAANAISIARGHGSIYEDKFDAEAYKNKLLSSFEGSFEWEDGIVCPRPYLQEFLYAIENSALKLAIYSTGMEIYLNEVLSVLCPNLLITSEFVWGRSFMWKQENRKIKDLGLAAKHVNIPIDEIVMLDDKEIIAPAKNWIQIPAFQVSPEHIEEAMKDQALLTILKTILGNDYKTYKK